MPHELKIDNRMAGINISLELHEMVLAKYWQEDDGYDSKGEKRYGASYRRALEDATAGYHLPAEIYRKIADMIELAAQKRMSKRNRR